MTISELKDKIASADKGIKSPLVDEKLKAGLRAKKADLEKQLADLEQKEKEEKEKKEAKKEEAKEKKAAAPKKESKPKSALAKLKERKEAKKKAAAKVEPKKEEVVKKKAKPAVAAKPKPVAAKKKAAKKPLSSVSKKAKELLSKLDKKARDFNKGRSAAELSRDAASKSKKAGKRVTADGSVYYENRPNRSDVNTRKKPYLEKGGYMADGGYNYGRSWAADRRGFNKREKWEVPTGQRKLEFGGEMDDDGYMARGGYMSKGELVWRKLSASKRMEFLNENFTPEITPRSQELLVGKDFNFLPKIVKIKLEAKYANIEDYASGGYMAKGGNTDDTPKIYVADLEAYNNGKLIGEWVDLSEYNDGSEVMDKISELLKSWSKEQGVEKEEYAIHDYENFPRAMYSEYMGENEFDQIIKAYKFSEERGVPMEVIGNIVREYNPDDIEEFFNDRYEGQFDSDEDLAYNYVEMMGGLSQLDQETIERYFDYESFGRDLAYDFHEYDGHYFRSYKKGGKLSRYNYGRSWAADRRGFNKRENYEKPMWERMFAEGGKLEDIVNRINEKYDGVVASKAYSSNRIQVVSPYFNTLSEIKRNEFGGSGLMEKYGNTSSYVLYSNQSFAEGGDVKKYTTEQLEELASDYAYVTGADLDKVTWRLLSDPERIPVYLKAIKEWEEKHNTKVSPLGSSYAEGGMAGKNINVFGYETKHFDICPTAVSEFEAAIKQIEEKGTSESEKQDLAKTAEYIDKIFAIEKGVSSEDYNDALNHLMTASMFNYRSGMLINMFSFMPMHMEAILKKKRYNSGGRIDIAAQNKEMLLNYAEEIEHHVKEFEAAAKKSKDVMPWVIAKMERASTDLADITHYLESENEKRREYVDGEGEEEYAEGGEIKWQEAELGDSALVVSENKMGVIIKPYGRKFHLKFVDGTEKTYDAAELKFFKDVDDFDRGGEVREFNVMYFKKIPTRTGEVMEVMRDRDIVSGSLEKVLSKAYNNFTMVDSRAMIVDRKSGANVADINKDGTGSVNKEGYGLNVGDIELEKQVEIEEVKPERKKLFGLFEDGGTIESKRDELLKSVYDEVKELFSKNGLKLYKDYSFEDGSNRTYLPFFSHQRSDDKLDKVVVTYYENGFEALGEIEIELEDGVEIEVEFPNWNIKEEKKGFMAMGGSTFQDKVKAVKSSLLKRKKVSPKVQKDYGKTYSPKEAEESAKRIVGAMTAGERLKARLKKRKK